MKPTVLQVPQSMASSFARHRHHSLSSYRLSYAVAGLTAFNSLSDDLHDPVLSTDSFRRLLKTRLFSEY